MAKAPVTKPVSAKSGQTGSVATRSAPQSLPLDIFKAAPQGGALAVGGSSTPYLQFYHPNAKNAASVQAALGKRDSGDPFLVRGGQFTLLDPLKFIITETFYQYSAMVDRENNIIQAWLPGGDVLPPKRTPEFIEALVFIMVDGNEDICCTRARLRGPKCKGFKQAHEEVVKLLDPTARAEWIKESKENAFAAKSPLPEWAWLTHEGTLTSAVSAPTLESPKGNPYETLTTEARVTPAVVLDTLNKALRDPEFVAACQAAQQDLMDRWEKEIKPKVKH